MIDIPLSMDLNSFEESNIKQTELFSFLHEVMHDWHAGQNPMILICGKSRTGKSTTASVIVRQLTQYLGVDISFIPEKHIASKVEKFLEMIRDNQNSILINEESEDELYSGNWSSLENKLFHKVLVSQGKQHNIYILIIHRLKDLNKNNRLKLSFVIKQKKHGFAVVKKITNEADDPEDKIKMRKLGNITYDTSSIDQELWQRWENIVNPIKDQIANESIETLRNKRAGYPKAKKEVDPFQEEIDAYISGAKKI